MHTFKVWASKAKSVEVEIGRRRYALKEGAYGWWYGDVPSAEASAEARSGYKFVIDGKEPAYPDPRSGWQPHGVHEPSCVVDHSSYAWNDSKWQAPPLAAAIIYELHLGVFTPEGTFSAAESKLEYLRDLGITHIELMPLATFPGSRGWGYDGVDLYAPHPAYGEPSDVKHFVDACHGLGLAVILDVVYNHLGPVGNYLGKFGPYFTASHSTPWGDAVNLEEVESSEVRRFFIDNALMWLRDYHFDGLRLDAVHAFIDRSAIHFLEQLASEVCALQAQMDKHLVLIAESDLNDPRLVRARESGGFGFDAQWNDDFHHALFSALTGERQGYYEDFGLLADLAKALQHVFVYDGNYSACRKRNHGRPVTGISAHRFLGYVQNHDQVGNRARGERISHLTTPSRTRIAAAMVLTSPFVPMLFQGEEFASSSPFLYFTDYEDLEMGRLISEGRKKEFAAFGWNPEDIPDPQEPGTYERSKLNWSELEKEPHRSLLQWYKDLIYLRRSEPDLSNGDLGSVRIDFDEEKKWMRMQRGHILVAFHLGNDSVRLDLEQGAEVLLISDPTVHLDGTTLTLGPDSIGILRLSARGPA